MKAISTIFVSLFFFGNAHAGFISDSQKQGCITALESHRTTIKSGFFEMSVGSMKGATAEFRENLVRAIEQSRATVGLACYQNTRNDSSQVYACKRAIIEASNAAVSSGQALGKATTFAKAAIRNTEQQLDQLNTAANEAELKSLNTIGKAVEQCEKIERSN